MVKERLHDTVGTSSALDPIRALYNRALPATRTGSLYGAFPYPTKISPEAIALFIAVHTMPGDTVFDGFAGSGTTGLASLLCEDPPLELRKEAERLGLNVKWGARNAILYEIGALGAFIAQTLTSPPDPKAFYKAAHEVLEDAEQTDGWMYCAKDPDGEEGTIRYLIWSDLLKCPSCNHEVSFWDACVGLDPAHIGPDFTCPFCAHECSIGDVERITRNKLDDILGCHRLLRASYPVRVYGSTGKRAWSRPVMSADISWLERIERQPIPESVPRVAIPWGDLHRSGYHIGITHLHHFYTRRNLIAFGHLWERCSRYDNQLRDALRFWLLSYNASHATIMTRVVAKSGEKNLVVTSAQPGVLYVSGLPVEKNLFIGLRRKLATIVKAFEIIYGRKGIVKVQQRSSCQIGLPDNSIDYIFIDPPFGGNIPYAEVNFINESWLGHYTDRRDEIIVSNDQGKTVTEYQLLLTTALTEMSRILRRDGKATVVFHSASANVWNALQTAYISAGFRIERASILDKTQGSFKQVTTSGAVKGDPVLLLEKSKSDYPKPIGDVWTVADQLILTAAQSLDPLEQTVQRLYSRLVTHYLVNHQQVPLDADNFYRWHAERSLLEMTASASK